MIGPVPSVDIRPDHWAIVRDALRRHVPDREVLAFGSRATWTAKDYSDLDLAVMGEEPLSLPTASALDEALGDSDLPFKVDVVDWARTDDSFRRIIRLHGIVVQGAPGSTTASVSVRAPSPKSRASATSRDRKSVARAVALEGLAHVIMGQSPAGSTVGRSNGMPLINGPTEFGPHHPEPVQYTSDPRKLAQPGDLLFCVRGATAGRMNWADQQYAIGRGIAAIRHRKDDALQPFLRAAISSELPFLLAATTGSVFRNVSASQLKELRVPDLSVSQQRAIAHVLGTLDDKIESNRRMNETLEAMARALFKSWFVDFDPVRAKMEGRDTGLPDDMAELFPDRLMDSEMGEVPEGWDVFRVDELTNHHTRSTSPFRSPDVDYEHFSIPAYDVGQHPTVEPGAAIKSNKTVVPDDAVLLSKLNPRIDRVWVPPASVGRPQICSTEFLAFTPKPPANKSLLFALFADQHFRALLKSMVTGTSKSHQRVPPRALKTQEVLVGSRRLFAMFGEATDSMLDRVLKNRSEAATLAALRDALLPKLISGEIRVPATDQEPGQ